MSRDHNLDRDKFLPLDHLQIWDCLSYDVAVIQKSFLLNLSGKVYAKDNEHLKTILSGQIQKIPGVSSTETFISLEESFKRTIQVLD